MPRTHLIDGVQVPFTPEEEAARDTEEAYEASPEREAERLAAEEAVMAQRIEVKGIDRAQFMAILDHENRIRALEGRPAVTVQDMKDWVKARL